MWTHQRENDLKKGKRKEGGRDVFCPGERGGAFAPEREKGRKAHKDERKMG